MILEGYVKDKNDAPVAHAVVEIKGDDFATIYSTESDEKGYYKFDIPAGRYAFLMAVKEYAVNYLEYWCQNIHLRQDMRLDVSFDALEVYGLHVFSVKGGGNGLMVYFRPMSLERFQRGERDVAPEDIGMKVMIDGEEAPVIAVNRVKEVAADREMSAYLIQAGGQKANDGWRRVEVQIRDKDGHYGAAAICNDGI